MTCEWSINLAFTNPNPSIVTILFTVPVFNSSCLMDNFKNVDSETSKVSELDGSAPLMLKHLHWTRFYPSSNFLDGWAVLVHECVSFLLGLFYFFRSACPFLCLLVHLPSLHRISQRSRIFLVPFSSRLSKYSKILHAVLATRQRSHMLNRSLPPAFQCPNNPGTCTTCTYHNAPNYVTGLF
jgi:hypothetical protein